MGEHGRQCWLTGCVCDSDNVHRYVKEADKEITAAIKAQGRLVESGEFVSCLLLF